MMVVMAKMGRPTDFNEELANRILERMCEGETVTQICKDADMPNKSTVFLWSVNKPDFSDRYLMAVKVLGQCRVDKIPEVIEDMRQGLIDHSMANVELNAIKWEGSKFYPKMYGDKQQVESKNENINVNADMPITDADREILRKIGWKGDN